MPAYTDWLLTNKWWPQTRKPKTAMAMLEKAIKVYPKGFLREKVLMISLITPIDGRIMM